MSKLKVTIKDVRNLQRAYTYWESNQERLQVVEDSQTAEESRNNVRSMKKTFEKVQDVLIEKLEQQDK
jgi:hypothetical protein|tara:strand:+ start:261 stop:464 length:204 start_codon:yes stop_codon:yes gene_type:complete